MNHSDRGLGGWLIVAPPAAIPAITQIEDLILWIRLFVSLKRDFRYDAEVVEGMSALVSQNGMTMWI